MVLIRQLKREVKELLQSTHPDKTVDSINAYTMQDYVPYRARKATVRILFNNSGQSDTVLVGDYCYIDGIFCYKN